MKIIMAMVMSADGKITKGNDSHIYGWTSLEDQEHFSGLIRHHNLIVMGSKMYDAARKYIRPKPGKLRIVLSQEVARYRSIQVAGQLECSQENPQALIARLESDGYKDMLLVGGGIINGLFFQIDAVDEVYLTIEPHLFGSGKPLVATNSVFDTNLQLLSVRRLNKLGTLLIHYKVIHSQKYESNNN